MHCCTGNITKTVSQAMRVFKNLGHTSRLARSNVTEIVTEEGRFWLGLQTRYSTHPQAHAQGPYVLRATAATFSPGAPDDLAHAQEWIGHASISTTRIYDRRGFRPEDSPLFKEAY